MPHDVFTVPSWTPYRIETDDVSSSDLVGSSGDRASERAGRSPKFCHLQAPARLIGKLPVDTDNYTPITREGEGVVMVCATRLAGRKPAVVLQNSGFGNSANPILSLLNYYRVCLMSFSTAMRARARGT